MNESISKTINVKMKNKMGIEKMKKTRKERLMMPHLLHVALLDILGTT